MSKMIGICAVCLCLVLKIVGQTPTKVDKEWVFNTAALVKKNISLVPRTGEQFNFQNLEKIEVIDARSDSSSVGFRSRSSEKKNDLIQFAPGLKNEFEKFFNRVGRFSTDSGSYSAIMVVRNFWLNEFDVDADEKDKTLEKRPGGYSERKTTLKATFDYYITRNDEYFVAYRFDTAATAFLNMKEFSETHMSTIVHTSLRRLEEIDPAAHIKNKRKISLEQLTKYYAQRWDKPILKQTQFERGVYLSFAEFLNNKPSIRDFVVKKDKLADVIYIPVAGRAGGELTAAREVWGYCDGKNLFIKSGENYFLLVRRQNTYYFMGSKELVKWQDDYYDYDPVYGASRSTTAGVYLRNRLFPMKLDMEKGTIY
jgi:hypothetical protein